MHSPAASQQWTRTALVTTLLVTSSLASAGTATAVVTAPATASTADGLSENESATLWSRDADQHRNSSHPPGGSGPTSGTAVAELASGTDITFTRPPGTAGTWTRADFEDLEGGGAETAVHPPHATLANGSFIKDAHATVFAVQPSTRLHAGSEETPLYIAPNGTVRGLVDYRVRVPDDDDVGDRTTDWSLVSHDIETVRVTQDGQTLSEQEGSHTPALGYDVAHSRTTTFTLEAEIRVELRKTTSIDHGNWTTRTTTRRSETLTVSDSIAVDVYNRAAHRTTVTYPNGDEGVAIVHSQPWQGYRVTGDGSTRVRGRWRFYTARDPRWDTLVESGRTDSSTVSSDAIPVYVHAYPSQIGPRVESNRQDVALLDTWGADRSSPAGTIGETVHVGVVTDSYTTTRGIAVRAETIDHESLRVGGIVHGTTLPVRESTSTREFRRSSLAVDVIEQNRTAATIRIALTDAETGAPIVVGVSSRRSPLSTQPRTGTITVGDQHVVTNASGVALVTLEQPGLYTVRYQPGSWLGHDPAYTSSTAAVRWHPLSTLGGWIDLLFALVWRAIPVVVVLYAGHQLVGMLSGYGRSRGNR